MTTTYSPESVTDCFCERVSDWCQENSVPYEDQVVVTFLPWLTNENFMSRYESCCEYLQWG
jgi:hypothetical protein